MTPSPALRARILQAAAGAPPSPTRRQRGRAVAWAARWCGLATTLELALLVALHPCQAVTPDLWRTAAWLLSAVGATLALRQRGAEALGPNEGLLWFATAGALFLPALTSLGATGPPSGAETDVGAPLTSLGLALALGLPPLLVVLFLRRGSDPAHPEAQGAAWGALFGCLSSLAVSLALPLHQPANALLGEWLPAALQLGAGSTLGAILLDLDVRPPRPMGPSG